MPDKNSAGPRHRDRRGPTQNSVGRGPPPALYVGARRSLCRGPSLSMSGPGALCVGARRSLCRGPALFVSGARGGELRSLCRAPALFLCRGPALFLSGPGALCQGLCRGPPILHVTTPGRAASVSELGALRRFCVGARRSAAVSLSGLHRGV